MYIVNRHHIQNPQQTKYPYKIIIYQIESNSICYVK
jgi:hypothetical protein